MSTFASVGIGTGTGLGTDAVTGSGASAGTGAGASVGSGTGGTLFTGALMHPNFCPQSLLCSSLPLLFLLVVVVSFCRNSEALHFRLFTGLEIPPSSHS